MARGNCDPKLNFPTLSPTLFHFCIRSSFRDWACMQCTQFASHCCQNIFIFSLSLSLLSLFRELSAGNSDGVNFSDEAAKKQQRQRGRKAKNYCRGIPTIVCTKPPFCVAYTQIKRIIRETACCPYGPPLYAE